MSNIPGLFVAGDALYASNCYGHAAATGAYAGRHASEYASGEPGFGAVSPEQVSGEMRRVYAPLGGDESGVCWKELNEAVAKAMRNYCGELKCDELLISGAELLMQYESEVVPGAYAANPHELVRLLEVFDILTVSQIIIEACLARKESCEQLEFIRTDGDGGNDNSERFIVIKRDGDRTVSRDVPLDYAGDLKVNYERYNRDYLHL